MKHENCLEKEIELPVGFMLDGKGYKNITVREVAGVDEEVISQPEYKDDMPEAYMELIHRCIVSVDGRKTEKGVEIIPNKKQIKNLPIGVLQTIVLEIRKLSWGDDYTFEENCPKEGCGKKSDGIYDLSRLKILEGDPQIGVELRRGIALNGTGDVTRSIVLNYPNGHLMKAAFLLQQSRESTTDMTGIGEFMTDIVFHCIEKNKQGKPDLKMVRNMVRADRKVIVDTVMGGKAKAPGPVMEFALKCKKCGTGFEHRVNPMDFLA